MFSYEVSIGSFHAGDVHRVVLQHEAQISPEDFEEMVDDALVEVIRDHIVNIQTRKGVITDNVKLFSRALDGSLMAHSRRLLDEIIRALMREMQGFIIVKPAAAWGFSADKIDETISPKLADKLHALYDAAAIVKEETR